MKIDIVVQGFEPRESKSGYKVFSDTEKIDPAGKTYGFGMNKNKNHYKKSAKILGKMKSRVDKIII